MKDLVIAGAGGHCRVALDIILDGGGYRPIGLLASDEDDAVLDVPVIGTDDKMEELYAAGVRHAFVAIGDNRIREKVTRALERVGFTLISPVSRYAIVSRYADIGAGTVVMPGAVVNAGARIGRGCIINTNCSVDHDCRIGDFVHIAPGCAVSGSTEIGSGSFLGTGARVIDKIKIGKNVMLGAGAVAIDGLPDNCTAVGVPAKIIKKGR